MCLQSERTASENKERAYIAASRRGDRSLEARVQSAYAASEIHKQRTGKALKVSEQIVLNEEMYEEEDDLPARYSALLNNNDILASMPRFQAYAIATLGTRAAAYDRFPNLQRDLQREADVNAQFAEFFGPRGFSTRPAGGFQTQGPGAQPAQSSPQMTATPFSPTTPSNQPAFHYPSPQNALGSPVDSHVGSPATANPMASNSGFPSPSMQMSMHQRSMSMGHMDALQVNTNAQSRASSISPVIATRASQLAGQRRSFDQAFPETQSPSSTPSVPAAFRQVSGMPSPGMPAPMGTPHQQNIQNRMSSQSIPMSPGSLQPAYGTGFTSELPGNLRGMFPQDTDFAGFFSSGQAPATTVSNATQAPFQLEQHGDLHELRARRQSRGRNTQQNSVSKKESHVSVKSDGEPTPKVKAEKSADKSFVKNEITTEDQLFGGNDPLRLYTGSQPLGAVKPETSLSDDAVTHTSSDDLKDSNLDADNFQQFYDADDFTTDFFNTTSNFDQFDFDSYLQLPASQPEVEND